MPTLISYNTSYVTDCHSSQFNPFMSESSSILKKAVQIYNSTHKDTEQINLKYKSDIDPQIKIDIEKLKTDTNIGENLDFLRKTMAETSTNYLSNFIEQKKPDFIALIEQTIHVGENNHAFYDYFMGDQNKFDLTAKNINNEDFGILKRIKALNFEDLDENGNNNTSSNYFIVYDNIVNKTAKNAEGIAIAFKKTLFNKQLKWNTNDHPSRKELLNDQAWKDLNGNIVSYFSADLGPIVCYEDPNAENKVIRYATGRDSKESIPIIDAGRPIIMTGGYSDEDKFLKLLVAIHGPNIPNLFPVDTKGVRGKKPLKDLLNDPKESKNAIKMFSQVRKSIGDFIQSGLDAINNKSEIGINSDTKVEIYLGGDLNDPRGIILESFINEGIDLILREPDTKKNVSFKRYKLTPKPEQIINGTDNQFRYADLKTCCANADSITTESGRNTSVVSNGIFNADHLFKLSSYPAEFHKPENFGYNGDYAMYGSSQTTKTGAEVMKTALYDKENLSTKNAEYLNWNGIYASDHLPVISETDMTGGKKNRRSKTRINKKKVRNPRRTKKYFL